MEYQYSLRQKPLFRESSYSRLEVFDFAYTALFRDSIPIMDIRFAFTAFPTPFFSFSFCSLGNFSGQEAELQRSLKGINPHRENLCPSKEEVELPRETSQIGLNGAAGRLLGWAFLRTCNWSALHPRRLSQLS